MPRRNRTAEERFWRHVQKTELITDYLPTGADAEMIAHAPEDIAALVAEVERLRGQVNAVKKIIRSPGITTVKGSPADRIMRILEVRK